MKVTVEKTEKREIPFPKLMRSEEGRIVLFIEEEKGTLLSGGSSYEEVGYYSECWAARMFFDFSGKITIKT